METLTLTELVTRLRRRWRTLVAGAAIGLALGTALHVALPTRYEAATAVVVDSADPTTVDMAAEATIATSRRVTLEALDALGDERLTITALERATGSARIDDSRLLRITASASSPSAAARRADAVAEAYLASRAVDAMVGAERTAVEATVVDPARTPTSPVGPGLLATLLGGTTLGLLVAAPVAAAVSRTPAARAS